MGGKARGDPDSEVFAYALERGRRDHPMDVAPEFPEASVQSATGGEIVSCSQLDESGLA